MITLGIDSGTQSTKTVALDISTGEILASAQQAYGFVEAKGDGAMEQDPAVWIAAVESTISQVLEKLGSRRSEVAGIGVSGQQHGLVLLDAADQVVRPAKLWCDTSTTAQCAELTKALGGEAKVVELTGNAMRVPVPDGSVTDFTVQLKRSASAAEVNAAFKAASEGPLKGILGYTDQKVVSTDFRGETQTSVFDAEAGIALDPTFVKLVSWYDNEWGYSNKVLEMVRVIAK
jgi:glycerol kinase